MHSLDKFRFKIIFLPICLLLTGCIGSGTHLIRSESRGAWETTETKSRIKGNPGTLVSSITYGRGNGDTKSASAKPYINIRENPDRTVDIIFFPGLGGPTQRSFVPNQRLLVQAKYASEGITYQYNFTADSKTGSFLFFTDIDKKAFIRKMESHDFVTLSTWDNVRNRQWVSQFVIQGRPHVLVRQTK